MNEKHRSSMQTPETEGLSKLGQHTPYRFDAPDIAILEAFPNRFQDRDYVITFEHPEFTSLCPMTGQPDFGTIRVRYVPAERCVESKSFKLYMVSFRNQGSFMESLTNTIADDLRAFLKPRRLTVEGIFNVRGGTAISVRVEHMDESLPDARQKALSLLW
ncbi:preQ(1) synthase [Desulfovibrio sp. OttesenSCG-928-M16]|nr:preQ(1) synthase [Desulfovibrio sp. OttesenSCG-928-M16]